MHFPANRDRHYFSQLTAERLIKKETRGKTYSVWECPPHRANEALDCRVYAFAALVCLQQSGISLNRKADEVGAAYTIVEVPIAPAPLPADKPETETAGLNPPPTKLVKVGEAKARRLPTAEKKKAGFTRRLA